MWLSAPIVITDRSLLVLIGASGSGKSTFARQHFRPSEIVSSDASRLLVADDESDQTATDDAFELLHAIASKRLRRGKLTVVDATNVQPHARRPLLELACRFQCEPVAIVFDLPEEICLERNASRASRVVRPEVIRLQIENLENSLRMLFFEGFRRVHLLTSPAEVAAVAFVRI